MSIKLVNRQNLVCYSFVKRNEDMLYSVKEGKHKRPHILLLHLYEIATKSIEIGSKLRVRVNDGDGKQRLTVKVHEVSRWVKKIF